MIELKIKALTDLLRDLEATAPDIEASAVASSQGFMIASALPQCAQEDRVAFMSAALLLLGEQAAQELALGEVSQVYMKGEDGYVVLMMSGKRKDAVFTGLARKDAPLTLVFLDMKRTAERVAEII